uniref:Thioredoxin domain-containing protein n=1 Tax=Schistosoma mansoni TaxID=6183 RepID=A0A5K4F6D0_SCHMA
MILISVFWILTEIILLDVKCEVFELDSRFIEFIDKGPWLVQFYAPWCGFCRRLAGTYEEASRILLHTEPSIKVARLDATIYTGIAKMFDVRGFPTIKYINGTVSYTFTGDRTVHGLVTFAQRANGPAVKHFEKSYEFEEHLKKLSSDEPFFFLIKPANSILEKTFLQVAEQLRIFSWFFSGSLSVITSPYIETLKSSSDIFTEILVFKDSQVYSYPGLFSNKNLQLTNNTSELYQDLLLWTLRERQPGFPKLSHFDWWEFASNELLDIQNHNHNTTSTNTTDDNTSSSNDGPMAQQSLHSNTSPVQSYRNYRLLGLFVIDQLIEKSSPSRVLEFGRNLALKRLPHVIRYFQLAWTNDIENLENLAMKTITIPNFIVLNPITYELYIYISNQYSSYTLLFNENNLINFLMLINDGKIKGIGGNTISIRLQRLGYNFLIGFSKFVTTRPLLALLILGVPALMFSGIVYLCCCLDANYATYDDGEDDQLSNYDIYHKELSNQKIIGTDNPIGDRSIVDSNSSYLDSTSSSSSGSGISATKTIHFQDMHNSPPRRRYHREVLRNSNKNIQNIGPVYSKDELEKRIKDSRAKLKKQA